jgi:hypothetical protein
VDEHYISMSGQTEDTMRWLSERGFIGAVVSNRDTGALPVLLVGKPGTVPVMAAVGNTLRWDGNALTVET